MIRAGFFAVCGLACCMAHAQFKTLPAPAGKPDEVSFSIIKYNEHPCPKIKTATRRPDGAIKALCTNQEDYLVFTALKPDSTPVLLALRCSAARKIGVPC